MRIDISVLLRLWHKVVAVPEHPALLLPLLSHIDALTLLFVYIVVLALAVLVLYHQIRIQQVLLRALVIFRLRHLASAVRVPVAYITVSLQGRIIVLA